MRKQYWVMDPSETSIFISFESRGEAEDWMREKQAFITSETSILYQAKIVETEQQKPVLDQVREVLGPAIKAAWERKKESDKGYLLNCPYCGESAQLVESLKQGTKAECAAYEMGRKCPVNPETQYLGEADDGTEQCTHVWNHRPEQILADDALIAAGLLLGVE